MAKIFKTDSQEKALKEIVESLKIVEALNGVLAHEDMADCKLKITGSYAEGTVNETVPMPFSAISSQLKDYRKKLVKDIQDKSKAYSISLDDGELEIISK